MIRGIKNNYKNLLLFVFAFTVCFKCNTVFGEDALSLHPFFEQNGDCYLLVGEGSSKAVWALNNLTTCKPKKLYDPYESYGLTATQKWNGSASEKDLFTFSAEDGNVNQSLIGKRVPRRMIVESSKKVYDFPEVAKEIVHRRHSWPGSSPTGYGNHDRWDLPGWSDDCIPCTIAPEKVVGGGPDEYWYPVGQCWYHCKDRPVWSPWTYTRMDNPSPYPAGFSNNPPPEQTSDRYSGTPDGGIEKGPWVDVCCSQGDYGMSGWCHRIAKDYLYGDYINMCLYSYRVGSGKSRAHYVRDLASDVLASMHGTQDLNGECTDGCIPAETGVSLPGIKKPVLQCVYSPITDRSYMYRRDIGSSEGEIIPPGLRKGYDIPIGEPNDVTCNHLGLSSKSKKGNYVYFLGKNQINKWLKQANYKDVVKDISDVAVSDQWWQKGGIVYAYEKDKDRVFQFDRNEEMVDKCKIKEIIINDDKDHKPDRIGADGFGNLFWLKTEYTPKNKEDFKDGDEYMRAYGGEIGSSHKKKFIAYFKQKVWKTVFKRSYADEKIEQIPSKVLLGENIFSRQYITEDDNINTMPKIWYSGLIQHGEIIDPNIRTELAVINSPTPPRPENINAVVDCIGPYVLDTDPNSKVGYIKAVANKTCPKCKKGCFDSVDSGGDNNLYLFFVENYPDFNVYDLNVGNVDRLVDDDEIVGRFPTTIKKSTVKYYWKIIQTKGRIENGEHSPVDSPVILDQEANGENGTYMLAFPPLLEGRYKVGVKVTYQYYDYSKLPVGALSDSKEDVLSGVKVARGAGVDSDGYAWNEIEIFQNRPVKPSKAGVIMACPTGNISGPAFSPKVDCHTHAWCAKNNVVLDNKDIEGDEPEPTYFIFDGYSLHKTPKNDDAKTSDDFAYGSVGCNKWQLQLRDTAHNCDPGRNQDRIEKLLSEKPPVPTHSKNFKDIVPGSLCWAGELLGSWKSTLKRNSSETLLTREVVTSSSKTPNILTDVRNLFPVPSEPYCYEVEVNMSRAYQYKYYKYFPRYNSEGNYVGLTSLELPSIETISISGKCYVCVTDNTPPARYLYNALADKEEDRVIKGYGAYQVGAAGKDVVLSATTGEAIDDTNIVFVVADTNPMANVKDFSRENSLFGSEGKDPYFSSIDNRLKINYKGDSSGADANYLAAVLYYDTVDRMYPTEAYDKNMLNVVDFKKYAEGTENLILKPEYATRSDVVNAGMKWFDYITYRKYTFNTGYMNKFSERGKNMDLYYANNKPGYKNLSFGIAWKEACHENFSTSDSDIIKKSTDLSTAAPYKICEIIIRDNERPTGYIVAQQDKYRDETSVKNFYSPSFVAGNSYILSKTLKGTGEDKEEVTVQSIYNKGWHFVYDDINNGVENWTTSNVNWEYSPGYDGGLIFGNLFGKFLSGFDSQVTTSLFVREPVEVDVPVVFQAKGFDNIGSATISAFSLETENGVINAGESDDYKLQYVYREPGIYCAKVTFEDGALTYPRNPLCYSPDPIRSREAGDPVGESPDRNKRTINAYFKVRPTKLQLKIIERNNRE